MENKESDPGSDAEVMTEEAMLKAARAIRNQLSHLEHNRSELDRAIESSREELRLLERIIALRKGNLDSKRRVPSPPSQSPRSTTAAGNSAVGAVLDELRTAGRPLHISELMRLLKERGILIPGSGTQANLITHLRRDDRIVRPSRGMYGLAAWGIDDMVTPLRHRRRKHSRVAVPRARTEK